MLIPRGDGKCGDQDGVPLERYWSWSHSQAIIHRRMNPGLVGFGVERCRFERYASPL